MKHRKMEKIARKIISRLDFKINVYEPPPINSRLSKDDEAMLERLEKEFPKK